MVGYKKGLTELLSLFNMGETTDSFAFQQHSTVKSKRYILSPSSSSVEPSFMTQSFRGASSSKLVMTPRNTDDMKLGMPASFISASAHCVSCHCTGSRLSARSIAQKVALTLFNTWAGEKLADWTKPLFSTGLKNALIIKIWQGLWTVT